jgi:hypothetical protein
MSSRWSLTLLCWLAVAPAFGQGARETAALAECKALADAEEMSAIYSGFYVSLEALNDTTFQQTNEPYDWINNGGGCFVMRPIKGRFEGNRFTFTSGGLLDPKAWNGPFVNFNGGVQTGNLPYDQGAPLDPWGNPYLFYTPLGLARGDSGSITLEGWGDRFDRYAVVSMGSNGVADPNGGDDLVYVFGAGVTALSLSSITGPEVATDPVGPLAANGHLPANAPMLTGGATLTGPAVGAPTFTVPVGATITLRGYSFGGTQSGARILFGERDMGPTSSWSDREITLTLPADAFGHDALLVERGAARSNAMDLQVGLPRNAAADWTAYR